MKVGDLLRFKETGCVGFVVETVHDNAIRVFVQWVDEETKQSRSEVLAWTKDYLLECTELAGFGCNKTREVVA